MTTIIHSNGSHCYGDEPDTIAALLEELACSPLDRRFEEYGNFVQFEPELLDGTKMTGMTYFFGNFLTVSHVFRIETDDPEIIAPLTAAIKANQQRSDYLSQSQPIERAA